MIEQLIEDLSARGEDDLVTGDEFIRDIKAAKSMGL
jgi:hypothetical protein